MWKCADLVLQDADSLFARDSACLCTQHAKGKVVANHTVRYRGEPSGSVAVNVGVLVGNVILCSGQSNSEHSNRHLGLWLLPRL